MSGAIKAYDSRLHQSNQGPWVHPSLGELGWDAAEMPWTTLLLPYTSMGLSASRWLPLKFTAVLLNFSIFPTPCLYQGKGLLPLMVYEVKNYQDYREQGRDTFLTCILEALWVGVLTDGGRWPANWNARGGLLSPSCTGGDKKVKMIISWR